MQVFQIESIQWLSFNRYSGIFPTDRGRTLVNGKAGRTDLSNAQEKIALLPDYGFKSSNTELPAEAPISESVVDTGKTVSGLVGGALTLLLAGFIGFALKRRKKNK